MFATLGAQSRKIRGKLVAEPNRRTDRKNHKIEVAPVKLDERGEDRLIAELLAAASDYRDDARYRAFPKRKGNGYNSNSFVSGLLRAVRLTPPGLRSRVRGYDIPVPEEFFTRESPHAELVASETVSQTEGSDAHPPLRPVMK